MWIVSELADGIVRSGIREAERVKNQGQAKLNEASSPAFAVRLSLLSDN